MIKEFEEFGLFKAHHVRNEEPSYPDLCDMIVVLDRQRKDCIKMNKLKTIKNEKWSHGWYSPTLYSPTRYFTLSWYFEGAKT